MKYIVKNCQSKIVLGYCYGCGKQCQNDCDRQCMTKF